jgi:hypothetical protein
MKFSPRLLSIALGLLSFLPATGLAHSLRIGANHYLLKYPAERPGPLTVYIFASFGDEIPIDEILPAERFGGITLLSPDGLNTPVKTTGGYRGGMIKLDHPGAYWLMSTTLPAISTRNGTRQMTYNYAKTLIQVSGDGADLTPSTKRLNQELEIVPATNPSGLAKGDALPLQIWLHGKPYSGDAIEVSAEHVAAAYIDHGVWTGKTDASGQVTMPWCAPGLWQLEVTVDVPASGDLAKMADKVRYRATLLFTAPGAKPIPRD